MPRCLEVVAYHDLEADNRKHKQLDFQREGGKVAQTVSTNAKEAYDIAREQHDHDPHAGADNRSHQDAEAYSFAHTRDKPCSVVESQQRLNRHCGTDKGQHGKHGTTLHNADRRQRSFGTQGALRTVEHQQIVNKEADN